VTLTSVAFSGSKDRKGTETIDGPYPLRVEGQVLEWDTPRGLTRHTFRFDRGMLVLPALVQKDDRTWVMETTWVATGNPQKPLGTAIRVEQVWQCSMDPRSTPRGPAEFPAVKSPVLIPKSYVYEEQKDEHGRPITVLRFFQQYPGAEPKESCRLFWDAEGVLHFEGNSWYLYQQAFYSSETR